MTNDNERLKLVAEVARRAREPGAAEDPLYFDLKARTFEAIAEANNPFGPTRDEALRLAETARAYAGALRALCKHSRVDTIDERGPSVPGNRETEWERVHRCHNCGARMDMKTTADGREAFVVRT